jgi:hypothetical protein
MLDKVWKGDKVGISVVDCKVTYVNDLRVTVLHAFKGTSLFMLLSMKGNLSLVTGNPVVCNMTAPVVVNMATPLMI